MSEKRDELLKRIERTLSELCAQLLEDRGQAFDIPSDPAEQWACH